MASPLLTIDALTIAFRQQATTRTVVEDLSLRIEAGETLALVGESGSGKSVSALSILRLLPSPPVVYPAGDILFHGESLLHASERTLRGVRGNKIAMIFQEPMVSLNPLHTLEKQLYEVLSLHRGMRREAARAEMLDCLDRVGIRNARSRLGDFPHQLSGGERQRVMIAMALLTRPELLIADEPTTALDVSVQAQILTLLRELRDELNMGLLFITHNLNIVRKLADNVAVMQNGRCVEQNRAATLFNVPNHPYTQKLINSEPHGEPVPLPPVEQPLLQVEKLGVSFPVRKGIFRRVVAQNAVVKGISFTLRAGNAGAGGRIRLGEKHHRPCAAAAGQRRGNDSVRRQTAAFVEPQADAAGAPPHSGGVSGSQFGAEPAPQCAADYRRGVTRASA